MSVEWALVGGWNGLAYRISADKSKACACLLWPFVRPGSARCPYLSFQAGSRKRILHALNNLDALVQARQGTCQQGKEKCYSFLLLGEYTYVRAPSTSLQIVGNRRPWKSMTRIGVGHGSHCLILGFGMFWSFPPFSVNILGRQPYTFAFIASVVIGLYQGISFSIASPFVVPLLVVAYFLHNSAAILLQGRLLN